MLLHFRPENAHAVPYGDQRILVAAKSMSLFVMDPIADAILTYAQAHARTTEEEILQALGARFSATEIQETLEELVRLHVFVTEQPQAKPIRPIVDVERFPLGSLVLNVANKCNLHCSYCYEPDAAKYGSRLCRWIGILPATSVDFLFQKAGTNPAR